MSNRFRPIRFARLMFVSLATAVGLSCGDDESTAPTTWLKPGPAVRIEISPSTLNLLVGTTGNLYVRAVDASGLVLLGVEAEWASLDPGIATISRQSGAVSAISPGAATITATAGSLTATTTVTVRPPDPPSTLLIAPDDIVLRLPGEVQLVASGRTTFGVPTPVSVVWTSQNPSVASVDKVTGIVTAVGYGETNIYATTASLLASVAVRVVPQNYLAQWAAAATASTSYSKDPDIWSAWQATGEPNVPTCAEEANSWASLDYTEDWLELTYAEAVRPAEISIHEVWAPGSIVKVEVKDVAGTYHVVYQASPLFFGPCLRKLTIPVEAVTEYVNVVRVTLDQRTRQDWNEIDAVRLSGYRKP